MSGLIDPRDALRRWLNALPDREAPQRREIEIRAQREEREPAERINRFAWPRPAQSAVQTTGPTGASATPAHLLSEARGR